MTALVDTNVLVRHLVGEPAEMAAAATAYLAAESDLLLTDLVLAEMIYVLESFYQAPRAQVANAARSLIAMNSAVCTDAALLVRAVEVYEVDRLDFAESYLVAYAESSSITDIVSFDRTIDRVPSVRRIEPS